MSAGVFGPPGSRLSSARVLLLWRGADCPPDRGSFRRHVPVCPRCVHGPHAHDSRSRGQFSQLFVLIHLAHPVPPLPATPAPRIITVANASGALPAPG